MSRSAIAPPASVATLPPGTRPAALLSAGDRVRTPEGTEVEVLRDPLTVHRGWSLFDDFEILVLVRLRALTPHAEPRDVRWRPDQPIELLEEPSRSDRPRLEETDA